MKNWNQGSLSRDIMPEEEIPTIDETFYPDRITDWEELLEKVYIEYKNETINHNRS